MQNFQAERCMHTPANCTFSGPIAHPLNAICFDGNLFTCQCSKEGKKAKGFKFALLLVFFKWHHCSERVNSLVCVDCICFVCPFYIYIMLFHLFVHAVFIFQVLFICPCSFLFCAASTFCEWFPHQCSAQQFVATPMSHSVCYELFGLGRGIQGLSSCT